MPMRCRYKTRLCRLFLIKSSVTFLCATVLSFHHWPLMTAVNIDCNIHIAHDNLLYPACDLSLIRYIVYLWKFIYLGSSWSIQFWSVFYWHTALVLFIVPWQGYTDTWHSNILVIRSLCEKSTKPVTITGHKDHDKYHKVPWCHACSSLHKTWHLIVDYIKSVSAQKLIQN